MTTSTIGSGEQKEKATPRIPDDRPPMARVIRAVMLKELRQNWLNLALVICLEFIIVCVAEWFRSGWLFDSRNDNGIRNILLFPAVTSAITLGCGVAGLLLGILQPLADRNFDLWAFLNHRPVPRWWLYLGRVAAGLILYMIAAGLPVAFALIIAPTKWGGRFFISDDMLPPIADWFQGIAYYFAGLLIMERQARWYGSRAAPIIVVLCGSILGMLVFSFWTAIAISTILMLMYVGASMGSAVSHGFSVKAPRWTTLILATILFLGFSALCIAPAASALDKVLMQRSAVVRARYYFYDRNLWQHAPHPNIVTNSSYQLTPDATLTQVITTSQWIEKNNDYERVSTKRVDLEGHPVAEPSAQELIDMQTISLNTRWVTPRSGEDYPDRFRDVGYAVSEMTAPIWHTKLENRWYWVPERRIYYVYRQPRWDSFKTAEEQRTAWKHADYLGAFGFNGLQERGPAKPFPPTATVDPYGDGAPVVLMPDMLYRLDFEHISLTPLFKPEAGETIRSIEKLVEPNAELREVHFVVITDKRIIDMNADRQMVIWTLPYTHDVTNESVDFEYFPKMQKRVIIYGRLMHDGDNAEHLDRTYEFYDASGKLLETKNIPKWWSAAPEPEPTLLPKGERILNRTEYRAGAIAAAGSPAIMAAAWQYWLATWDPAHQRGEAESLCIEKFSWRVWATALPIMAAYAIGAWLLAWVYARSMAGCFACACFAFLFGPAALLTFLALHRFPRWARCPSCRRMRLRRDQQCAKCGAAWPAPPVTGTEIFVG